jgi:prevent-host-death family protein
VKQLNEHTVGAFDAKTNLGQLLDRVERGETIVITRHGTPVARLVPFVNAIDRDRVQKAIHELKKLSKGQRLPAGTSLKDLVDEGRRH